MRAKSRIARAVTVCLLILLASAIPTPSALADDTPWIRLERGPTYELLDDADSVIVHVPVTLLASVKPQDVTLKLLDVRFGRRYETRLLDAFTLQPMEQASSGHGPALEIVVDLTKAAAQGSYNLLIEATTGTMAPQTLELEIVHPTAKLMPIAPLVVEEVDCILRFCSDINGTPLIMSETSGLSRLTGITLKPLDFFGESSQLVRGSITFDNAPHTLAPRTSASITYTLQGNFPLGITRGNAVISAPQLTDPLLVTFEVHKRLAPWYVLIVIAIGLLLGWVSRTRLQNEILLNEMRLKGCDLQAAIEHEIRHRTDADFQAALTEPLATLSAAIRGRDVSQLTNAINAAGVKASAGTR